MRYSRSISKPIADSHAGVASAHKRRLLVIPFQPEAVSHELWELDVNTGDTRRLTDPDVTPVNIASGDWTVSPDGRHVAFLDSRDGNICC
jgi:Tol biopolymer transport system component